MSARVRGRHLANGSKVQRDSVHLAGQLRALQSTPCGFVQLLRLTQPKSATERIKLLMATAIGVLRCNNSNGMTGSAAHLSSTARKIINRPADVPNSPRINGDVHLYASTEVEFVLRETATRADPTHPAKRIQPSQSIRRRSCAGVCFTRGVAVPEVGSEGTA